MKKKINGVDSPSAIERAKFRLAYVERIYNIWLNKYEVEGVSRDEREFILRALWAKGYVAAFNLINPNKSFMKSKPEYFSDTIELGYADAAFIDYNIYNRPISCNLINLRGSPYIPGKEMIINKDVVLITATHTLDPLYSLLAPFIDRVIDIEMTLRANLKGAKLTRLIEVTDDSKLSAEDLGAQLDDDDPAIFVNSGMADALRDIGGATVTLIDTLYKYKKDVENEILTILGINNTPFEKKERLVTDEVNSNNELIESNGGVMDDCLKESCDLIKEVFGKSISFTQKKPEIPAQDDIINKEDKGAQDGRDIHN